MSPQLAADVSDIADFERVGQARIAPEVWGYISGGADSESTVRRNVHAFDWVNLEASNPVPASSVRLTTSVLGIPLTLPFMVGPTSGLGAIDPDGDILTYRGATAEGVGMVLSQFGRPTPRVAAAADGTLCVQAYFTGERAILDRISQAHDVGCRAVFITVDSPYQALNLRQARTERASQHGGTLEVIKCRVRPLIGRTTIPPFSPGKAYSLAPGRVPFTWKDLESLSRKSPLPVVVKGISRGGDAELASQHGAAGVVVSTHGGRVQDRAQSSLEGLPEVVRAVRGKVAVFFDSGVRGGADILKALALGADTVLLGRPILWGLAAFGTDGVQRVLHLMRAQLVDAMARHGVASVGAAPRALAAVSMP